MTIIITTTRIIMTIQITTTITIKLMTIMIILSAVAATNGLS